MRAFVVTLALAVGSLMLVGCKSEEEKELALGEELADIFDKNKDNCDKMAEELEKFKKDKGPELKVAKERDKARDKDEKAKKAFEEKYKTRTDAIEKKMMGSAMKCMENEKVKKAVDGMM
jgi:uncharacterized protein YdiU (UPF0061 family)